MVQKKETTYFDIWKPSWLHKSLGQRNLLVIQDKQGIRKIVFVNKFQRKETSYFEIWKPSWLP